ncbi:MAG: hypothetical protein HOH04_10425 [Rhodospirillaceae bacterium]|nr:hypothetical protein [Rhodospirillaceae bacterium]
MSSNVDHQEDFHDDFEDHEGIDSGFYGIRPGIVGVLIGLALIGFMFALADGFA